ncbi:hypothetical protein HAHE_04880 [Haloferula helveola]|uniref:Uncharacterized protein n=1 Tax=Haloferula helveola TaxID=490095 RepID=A0ABN6H4U1_9BACT|nr:hypothetical protein HAHE_04880 [Haloferula helveola]
MPSARFPEPAVKAANKAKVPVVRAADVPSVETEGAAALAVRSVLFRPSMVRK